jgi:ribosomal protein L37AE/L43A
MDWYQLAQLGGGILVACLALEAWWRPGTNSPKRRAEAPRPARNEAASPQASLYQAGPAGREVYQADEVPFLPKINVRFKTARKSHGRNRKSQALDKVVISRRLNKASARPKGLFRRKPNLQISMYENHRCPYCLEDVVHNDPRGVKRCDVCNTLHHADCWEITGSCQVPHLNS